MKLLSFIILLFIALGVYSQTNVTINGQVKLEGEIGFLEGAKVRIFNTDTTLANVITDPNGVFNIHCVPTDSVVNLEVLFIYCEKYTRKISLKDTVFDLGIIVLQLEDKVLESIVVTSDKEPIVIKNDTILYDVASFNTPDGATAEDLLRVLPGVLVDANGKITVNGVEVDKIYVNGKPFFGNDLTLATRSLTKDMLETVEVTNTRSKSEAFTGEDGSEDSRTINLIIQEDKNQGYFGSLSAGGGTNEHYDLNGVVNRFNDTRRFSIVAGTNNINNPKFSLEQNVANPSVANLGSSEGIISSHNYGINYVDDFGEKVSFSGSYFRSVASTLTESTSSRDNTLPDLNYLSNSSANSLSSVGNHNIRLNFDFKINEDLLISIRPSVLIQNNDNEFGNNQLSFNDANALTNQYTSNTISDGKGLDFENSGELIQKIGTKGAYLKFEMINEVSRSKGGRLNFTNIINTFSPEENELRDQNIEDYDYMDRNMLRGSYKLVLIEKVAFLTVGMDYTRYNSFITQSAFDKADGSDIYDVFNTNLSLESYTSHNDLVPKFIYFYKKDKWRYTLNGSYTHRIRSMTDFLRPEQSVERTFKGVDLSTELSHKFSPGLSLSGGYRMNNSPPQLLQIQSFTNAINPLNIIVGNPDLSQETSHSFSLRLMNFNLTKGRGIFSSLRLNIRDNSVVQKSTIDENFIRTTSYVNVDGAYQLSGNIVASKSFNIDSSKTMALTGGINSSYNKRINFVNNVEYGNALFFVSPRLGVDFTQFNRLKLTVDYDVYFTRNILDLDIPVVQDVFFHQLGFNADLKFLKHFNWANRVAFTYNPEASELIQKGIWLWNNEISYSFLNDNAKVTLQVYDLLNQNRSNKRTVTTEFIEEKQSLVLERYFMLYFTWKINKF